MLSETLLSVALIHLGLLFSVAGLTKSFSPRAFAQLLGQHGLIPKRLCLLTAWSMFTGEIFLGIWLVSGIEYRIATACASLLLAAFVLYRVGLKAFGPDDASCGCLGNSNLVGPEAAGVVLNLFVALTVTVIGASSNRYSMPASVLLAALLIVGLMALAARQRRPVADAPPHLKVRLGPSPQQERS